MRIFVILILSVFSGVASAAGGDSIFSPNKNCTAFAESTLESAGVTVDTPLDSFARKYYRVYDEYGHVCLSSPGRLKHGDSLRVGFYLEEQGDIEYNTVVNTCEREADGFLINEAGWPAQSVNGVQGAGVVGTPKIHWFPELDCFSDDVVLKLRNSAGSDTDSPRAQTSITQYPRYRGALQFGLVKTKAIDRNYSLVNGLIQADQDASTGPEYVASLLVYGLPHYWTGFGKADRKVYKGRDIVNEHGLKDRLSLSFSVGVDNPKDVLGIGLGFEVVKGINFTVTSLYQKANVLNGVSVGDTHTGDIPQRSSWENEIVWGISIDGRYLTRLFSGGGE